MIHRVAKTFGISKQQAGMHSEYDFWEMLAYENLQAKQQEYLFSKTKESYKNY